MISVSNLSKSYKIYRHQKGWANNLKTFFRRPFDMKPAIENISFEIGKGEIVGYIGPNGAGKSTTIKILSGVLVPSAGDVLVDGLVPYKNRMENSRKIGVVFGQRSHLHWDLPVIDSFDLYQKMYRIPKKQYSANVDFFTELLAMGEYITKPVRQLSLGQKMRAELAGALLHEPQIIYLDEPTIGLDVVAKAKIREFIKEVNREKHTTVIITTHDMDDIESLCSRLIMIDSGRKLYDGPLREFKETYGGEYKITVEFDTESVHIQEGRIRTIGSEGNTRQFMIRQSEISIADAISHITRNHSICDLSIEEPDVEGIVKKIYQNDMDISPQGKGK